jgi:hypothetical protein
MSAKVKKEIGHVLFIDIVDYSKLSINEQHAAVKESNQIVRASRHPIRDFINFTILIIRICACLRLLNVFIPPAPLLMILGIVKGGHRLFAATSSWRPLHHDDVNRHTDIVYRSAG